MKLRKALRGADALLLDLCWPTGLHCAACDAPSRGALLCADCAEALAAQRLSGPLCPVCGHPLDEDGACDFCEEPPLFARAAWPHAGVARSLVHQLKLQGHADAAIPLAAGMAESLRPALDGGGALLTYVSTPPARLRERPFDHAALLCRAVAEQLGLPWRQTLRRPDSAGLRHQLGLSRADRLNNLRGTFACPERLSGTVVLVDDVMTTGSTARAACETLAAAGAEQIWVLTATQAQRKR